MGLDRQIDLEGISNTITTTNFSRMKDDLKSLASEQVNSYGGGVVEAMNSDVKVPSEVKEVLEEFCDSKAIPKGSKDYIGNLNRLLKLHPELDFCDAVRKTSEIDGIILNGVSGIKKIDISNMVKKSIGEEMGVIGYDGDIPDCLFDNILGKLSGLDAFSGLPIKDKLDLLSSLKGSCGKDVVNSLGTSLVKNETFKGVFEGLLDNDVDSGLDYLRKKADIDPQWTLNALERTLNEKEGKHTLKKLKGLRVLRNEYPDLLPGGLDIDNITNSIRTTEVKSTYMGMYFEDIEETIGSELSLDRIRENKNLKDFAISYTADKAIDDSTGTLVKQTDIDLATKVLISEL